MFRSKDGKSSLGSQSGIVGTAVSLWEAGPPECCESNMLFSFGHEKRRFFTSLLNCWSFCKTPIARCCLPEFKILALFGTKRLEIPATSGECMNCVQASCALCKMCTMWKNCRKFWPISWILSYQNYVKFLDVGWDGLNPKTKINWVSYLLWCWGNETSPRATAYVTRELRISFLSFCSTEIIVPLPVDFSDSTVLRRLEIRCLATLTDPV